jgi:hypothetical protein
MAKPFVVFDGEQGEARLVALGNGDGMAQGLGDDVAGLARQVARRKGAGGLWRRPLLQML